MELPKELLKLVSQRTGPAESYRLSMASKNSGAILSDVAVSYKLIKDKALPFQLITFFYVNSLYDEFSKLDLSRIVLSEQDLMFFTDQMETIIPNNDQKKMFKKIYSAFFNEFKAFASIFSMVFYGAMHGMITDKDIPQDEWEWYIKGLLQRDDPSVLSDDPEDLNSLSLDEWNEFFVDDVTSLAIVKHFDTELDQYRIREIINDSLYSFNKSETLVPNLFWILNQVNKDTYQSLSPDGSRVRGPINKVAAKTVIEYGRKKGWWKDAAGQPVVEVLGLILEDYLDSELVPQNIRTLSDLDLASFDKVIKFCKNKSVPHIGIFSYIQTTDRFLRACDVLKPVGSTLVKLLSNFHQNYALYTTIVDYIKSNNLVVTQDNLAGVLKKYSTYWQYKAVEELMAHTDIRIKVPSRFRYFATLRFGGHYDGQSYESLLDYFDESSGAMMALEIIKKHPDRVIEYNPRLFESVLDYAIEYFGNQLMSRLFDDEEEGTLGSHLEVLTMINDREPSYITEYRPLPGHAISFDDLKIFQMIYPERTEIPIDVIPQLYTRWCRTIIGWIAGAYDEDIRHVKDI